MARKRRVILTDEQVTFLVSRVTKPSTRRIIEVSVSEFGVSLSRGEATRVTRLMKQSFSEGGRKQLRVLLPRSMLELFDLLCSFHHRSAIEQMTFMIHAAISAATGNDQHSSPGDQQLRILATRMLVAREAASAIGHSGDRVGTYSGGLLKKQRKGRDRERQMRVILSDDQVTVLLGKVTKPSVQRIIEVSASEFGVSVSRSEATRVTELLKQSFPERARKQLRVLLPQSVLELFDFLCSFHRRSAIEQMKFMIRTAITLASTTDPDEYGSPKNQRLRILATGMVGTNEAADGDSLGTYPDGLPAEQT